VIAPTVEASATPSAAPPAAVSAVAACGAAAALLDPLRLRVLDRLREPDSAAGVARALGLPRQRVGYHVRELERHGLLRHVGERRRGNCLERLVQVSARHYLIAPEALGALGLDPRQVRDHLSSAYLAAVASQTARDVALLQADADAAGLRLPTLTLETEVRFASPESQHAFARELADAVTRIAARHHDDTAPRGRRFRFLVGGYPAPAEAGAPAEEAAVERVTASEPGPHASATRSPGRRARNRRSR